MTNTRQLAQKTVDRTLDFQGRGDDLQGSSTTTNFNVSFGNWVGNLMTIIMTMSFLILLLYLIWGAVEWITSAGDSGKLQSARNRMLHAIVGMIILASVVGLVMFVQYLLGVTILVFNLPGGAADRALEAAQNACKEDDRLYLPRLSLAAVHLAREDQVEALAAVQECVRTKPDIDQQEIIAVVGERLGAGVWAIADALTDRVSPPKSPS